MLVTACHMPRKDIQPPSGFVDLTLTLSAKARIARAPNPGFSFLFHWESAITGCTVTADRLAAAGLAASAQCRFCAAEKESTHHFLPKVPTCQLIFSSPRRPFTLGQTLRCLVWWKLLLLTSKRSCKFRPQLTSMYSHGLRRLGLLSIFGLMGQST